MCVHLQVYYLFRYQEVTISNAFSMLAVPIPYPGLRGKMIKGDKIQKKLWCGIQGVITR